MGDIQQAGADPSFGWQTRLEAMISPRGWRYGLPSFPSLLSPLVLEKQGKRRDEAQAQARGPHHTQGSALTGWLGDRTLITISPVEKPAYTQFSS